MHSANLLYQYWIHTERIDRLPRWFEFTLNTPSHHRVHQAPTRVPGHQLRRHPHPVGSGCSLIRPLEDKPVTYGLTKNINTHNPIKVAWGEFAAIAGDVRRSDSWGPAGGTSSAPPAGRWNRRRAVSCGGKGPALSTRPGVDPVELTATPAERQQLVEVEAGVHPGPLQGENQILGGDVAGGPRGEGQPPMPPGRVEHCHSGLVGGQRTGISGVAVLWTCARNATLPTTSRTAATRRRTSRHGHPMVSAIAISATPLSPIQPTSATRSRTSPV